MELKELPTKVLIEELNRRSETQKEPTSEYTSLVCGVICGDIDGYYIESFKKVESKDDLGFLNSTMLRSRFNSHRNYELFHFKTSSFELLSKQYKEEPKEFAKWVKNNELIKFSKI